MSCLGGKYSCIFQTLYTGGPAISVDQDLWISESVGLIGKAGTFSFMFFSNHVSKSQGKLGMIVEPWFTNGNLKLR